jgi:hypothetical protein
MFASIFGKSVLGRKALPSGAIEGKKPVLREFCPLFLAINPFLAVARSKAEGTDL